MTSNNLRIDTGTIRLTVNDDPNRVVRFNPGDVAFAEKFYTLLREFEGKQKEYQARAAALDADTSTDDLGLPANLGAGIAFLREICTYLRQKIDDLFGAGTSDAAFEDAMTLEMFDQFFSGITPYFQQARTQKMTRYLNNNLAGKGMGE